MCLEDGGINSTPRLIQAYEDDEKTLQTSLLMAFEKTLNKNPNNK